MLQEIFARSLGVELGVYKQFVGSLHLYDKDAEGAQQFMSEDIQSTVEMPEMPQGDPWPSIQRVLSAEHDIRNGLPISANDLAIDPYWSDLIRLLQIFFSTGDASRIEEIKSQMSFSRYGPYIEQRKSMERLSERKSQQLKLL
jgi:thymidylate synthase